MDNLLNTSVVRVSIGIFDPANIDAVRKMTAETGTYLIPAIKELKGLLYYYAAVSDKGSMTNVSIWESNEDAEQMDKLQLMIMNARQATEAAGVTFIPIINCPIMWSIEGNMHNR